MGCTNMADEEYPCKYNDQCKIRDHFNLNNYTCTHGGGVACYWWRKHTDESMGWNFTHGR